VTAATDAVETLLDALAERIALRVADEVAARLEAHEPPAALSTQRAADYLGVSFNHVRRMIEAGTIRPVRLGGRVTIPRAQLDALLAAA